MALETSPARRRVRMIGFLAGPILGAVLVAAMGGLEIRRGESIVPFDLAGRATLGLMAWMAVWWTTEAIDVAATALLPLAVLPLATAGAYGKAGEGMAAAARPYASPLIALFLGGFMIALAMERWGLHRRIALLTLRFAGTRPGPMVGGFMAVTAATSMWVSNTATTAMMLPIALSVVHLVLGEDRAAPPEAARRNFALCLMLGVAYAASVGGIGTLVGTPPNLLLAAFVRETYGVEIGFRTWLAVGLPLVAVFVPLIWILLTRIIYPLTTAPIEGGSALIRAEYAQLGPMKRGEWATLTVFLLTAAAWIARPQLAKLAVGGTRPLAGLTDGGIAMIAAAALFTIPLDLKGRRFVMNWEWGRRVPWGIIVLFGGGLSLAAAVDHHGVADLLGGLAGGLGTLPTVVVVTAVAAGVIFLTELTSNTATTATLLPILGGLAPSLGLAPMVLLVPAVIAASCAFMMPVATPPNAIVFGTGHVTIPQMCRAGLWLNVIGIVLVVVLTYTIVVPLLAAG